MNLRHYPAAEALDLAVFAKICFQANRDETRIDVSGAARQTGIPCPVLLTRAVYDGFVAGDDERLSDLITATRLAILRAKPGRSRLPVMLYVRNDDRTARLVRFDAVCSRFDAASPAICITVMLMTEH